MNDKLEIEITDDEDVARAKAWWKENGSSIIGGIAIGTALVVGYNFWNQYAEKQAQQASALYQQVLNDEASDSAVQSLVTDFDGSVYSTLASLQQAKAQVEKDELGAAANTLESAINLKGTDAALASIVRLRLAAVLIADGNTDKALTVLNGPGLSASPAVEARVEELKGDAYFGKSDLDAAKAAYEASLAAESGGGQSRALVQLKLDNL